MYVQNQRQLRNLVVNTVFSTKFSPVFLRRGRFGFETAFSSSATTRLTVLLVETGSDNGTWLGLLL